MAFVAVSNMILLVGSDESCLVEPILPLSAKLTEKVRWTIKLKDLPVGKRPKKRKAEQLGEGADQFDSPGASMLELSKLWASGASQARVVLREQSGQNIRSPPFHSR